MNFYPSEISKNLSSVVVFYHPKYKDKEDNIRHGLEWIISCLNQFLLVLLLSYPFNLHMEALICLASGALLKMFAGGIHFSGYFRCLLFSSFQVVLIATFSNALDKVIFVQYILYLLICISFYILLVNAPKLYKKKDHFTNEQKNKLKIAALTVFLFLSIYSLFLQPSYKMCILASMLLQVYSVTKIGEITTLSIDNWLSNILQKRRDIL
ncbi:accessory gene regulator B family protein [Bacillus aquiflavi]|uniref:Accessory gene regulator B family protein n=1 Tax=Bacillus aquiflavi TaxID=2672567 RepID=A0A6B3W6M7_9BACI|nr:accessory gene regulator B family protein [Bacillus aquiflavi]MBA4538704.1 accessory gene regulator B family protein [Bacillus aquiflavi]NEY83064.1 accessory gene regulator B family protein [Bacillus aquiflavi]UAC48033.1 accessory gene regulator B family protein [Bacillus aquiflavi]